MLVSGPSGSRRVTCWRWSSWSTMPGRGSSLDWSVPAGELELVVPPDGRPSPWICVYLPALFLASRAGADPEAGAT